MFHILGSPRSGTTLVAQCLSAHAEILVPHDTDFLSIVAFISDRIRDEAVGKDVIAKVITESESFDRSIGEYLTRDRVCKLLTGSEYKTREMIVSIFFEISRKHGAKIVGNKSTKELWGLEFLRKMGAFSDDDIIIHVVRDCRDVMASLIALDWINKEQSDYATIWSNENILLNIMMGKRKNYRLIKYEEFVESPASHLKELCQFIGVEYQENMLDPRKRHKRYLSMQTIHPRIYLDIDACKVGRHKSIASPLIDRYTRQAAHTLVHFGYEI